MTTDFSRYMADVAALFRGDPNPHLSTKTELRYGTHGSLSVEIEKGIWSDHESREGGGVLDFIRREAHLASNREAVDWLKKKGFPVEDEPHTNGHAPTAFEDHARPNRKIVAIYDYVDEFGQDLFQVVRFEPKDFRQRRKALPPDEPSKIKDGWVWSVRGVRLVPYKLPELLETLSNDRPVFIVEGEKDVENLAKIGVPATCNPMGAGK